MSDARDAEEVGGGKEREGDGRGDETEGVDDDVLLHKVRSDRTEVLTSFVREGAVVDPKVVEPGPREDKLLQLHQRHVESYAYGELKARSNKYRGRTNNQAFNLLHIDPP